MDIVERLREGVVEYPKRWSGDTHTDKGGSVDYEASAVLMNEAADLITRLRSLTAEMEKKLAEKGPLVSVYCKPWRTIVYVTEKTKKALIARSALSRSPNPLSRSRSQGEG